MEKSTAKVNEVEGTSPAVDDFKNDYKPTFANFGAAENVVQEVDLNLATIALNPTEMDVLKQCHFGGQFSFLFYATLVASCGGIIFGYDTAGINGILIMPAFLDNVGREGLSRAEWAEKESWIVASLLLGCFFGAPFAAVISDYFGRKWSIMAAYMVTCVGSAIQAALLNYDMMIAGRVICGFGIGLLSGIIPTYLAEVTPQSVRGSVGSFFYLTLACGILAAHLITQAFNTYSLDDAGEQLINNWRYILGIQGILALVLILCMVPLEESPRWLIKTNQIEKARAVLVRTRWAMPVGRRKDDQGEWQEITNVDLELDEIVHEVAINRPLETPWYDFTCLLAPDVILRTTMGILIQFFQQLCGINAFFYYSSIIFRDLGITPDTTTSITGAVSVAATFICCFYIERVGRRSLQIWGSIGMMYSLIVVASVIYACDVDPDQSERDIIIVFICLYIVHFSYSYGPIAWLYPPETYPLHLRAKGASISTAANWLADFAVAKSVPEMILPGSSVGGIGGLFFFYAAWSFTMTIWAMFQMHETMNLALEHVDPVFGVSNFEEWCQYSVKNFEYTFYFGPMTMFEYTQHNKKPYGTRKSYFEESNYDNIKDPYHQDFIPDAVNREKRKNNDVEAH